MSKSVILSMLAQGNTGNEILNILDVIVEDITQENMNDFVQHAVALNMPTTAEIAF
jgi:hypothetical protein